MTNNSLSLSGNNEDDKIFIKMLIDNYQKLEEKFPIITGIPEPNDIKVQIYDLLNSTEIFKNEINNESSQIVMTPRTKQNISHH